MTSPEELYPEAYKICKKFYVSDTRMVEIMNLLRKDIEKGLAKATHPTSIVKCFVTYVQDMPSGKERGSFLALDLGGTNFRVLMVTLISEGDVRTVSKSYVVSPSLMEGPGTELFDHIAECLYSFVNDHNVQNDMLPLGFTFSFPVKQIGLTRGTLVAWTKGFSCAGVVNEDVVRLLKEAIARHGNLRINIVALLNDTTGTLMSCAWKHLNCRIGAIIGTGSNACYVEKVTNAEMFDGDKSKPYVIINCEWGAFGDNGTLEFIRNDYDRKIDKDSVNPGHQLFEKCISGMYLGEMVRLIIVDLMEAGVIFEGQDSERLKIHGKFDTKYISEVENDQIGTFNSGKMVMDRFGIRSNNDNDFGMLRYICEVVSTRSARLVAAGLACLTNKMEFEDIVIGIDGGVYRFHPHYHNLMTSAMKKLVDPNKTFQTVASDDGSGRGAALIAAVSNESRLAGVSGANSIASPTRTLFKESSECDCK